MDKVKWKDVAAYEFVEASGTIVGITAERKICGGIFVDMDSICAGLLRGAQANAKVEELEAKLAALETKPAVVDAPGDWFKSGLKYTLAEAMEDAAGWIEGETFHADSRGWRPAVALMREKIVSQSETIQACCDERRQLVEAREKAEADALRAEDKVARLSTAIAEFQEKYAQEVAINIDAGKRTAAAEAKCATFVGELADALKREEETDAKLIEAERVLALAKEQFVAVKKRADELERTKAMISDGRYAISEKLSEAATAAALHRKRLICELEELEKGEIHDAQCELSLHGNEYKSNMARSVAAGLRIAIDTVRASYPSFGDAAAEVIQHGPEPIVAHNANAAKDKGDAS